MSGHFRDRVKSPRARGGFSRSLYKDRLVPESETPQYTRYRARPQLFRRTEPEFSGPGSLRGPKRERGKRKPITAKRVIIWLLIAVGAWLLLSLVLFLVSAQFEQDQVSDAAKNQLSDGGPLPFSSNTVLVIGSDARPPGTHEGGANVVGQPSRSDTLMLIRTGGGSSARLSIPRDTIVDIPGHGQDKVNAAYAIGGTALTITTLKRYLGIDINHVVEVNFVNFPKFINSLGGIDFDFKHCLIADINGGKRNGGVSLRFKKGEHHLNGKQTLAVARVRKNECRPGETDIDRALRQQQILSAVKGSIITPGTFFRLPWVSWQAPQAIRSDMGGVSLLGLFGSLAVGGTPPTRVLKPSGVVQAPGGGQGLVVSEQEKRSEVRRFENG
jgi:LCP family protein required for cell wall assembly